MQIDENKIKTEVLPGFDAALDFCVSLRILLSMNIDYFKYLQEHKGQWGPFSWPVKNFVIST